MLKTTVSPSISSLNSIDVTIEKESHTVAAPIVERLLKDPDCLFAAYKIEHPFDERVILKIQGNEKRNSKSILEDGLRSIIRDIDELIEKVRSIEE